MDEKLLADKERERERERERADSLRRVIYFKWTFRETYISFCYFP